jgi:hypothetical protein
MLSHGIASDRLCVDMVAITRFLAGKMPIGALDLEGQIIGVWMSA